MKKSFDRKDRLERFVRDNRSAFDSEEPDDLLWGKIEGRLTGTPGSPQDKVHPASPSPEKRWKRQISYDWRVAAAVLVICTAGIFVYVNNHYGLARDPQMAIQLPTYAKEVNQYTMIINAKRDELKRLTASKPELYTSFAAELSQLENDYSGLRSELPGSPDPDIQLHAMVRNLQWQIDLLNQQIIIIEKIKKANGHEKDAGNIMAI